eukprot:s294_g15.t1
MNAARPEACKRSADSCLLHVDALPAGASATSSFSPDMDLEAVGGSGSPMEEEIYTIWFSQAGPAVPGGSSRMRTSGSRWTAARSARVTGEMWSPYTVKAVFI